jgi:hypothetical protein
MRKRPDTAMIEALVKLHDLGFQPDQPTENQLKIGDANYYAGKGTVFVDGETARRDETGFDALVTVLRKLGYLDDSPDERCPTPAPSWH